MFGDHDRLDVCPPQRMNERSQRPGDVAETLVLPHPEHEYSAFVHRVLRLVTQLQLVPNVNATEGVPIRVDVSTAVDEEPRLQVTARTDVWDRQDLDAIGGTRAPRPRQDFKGLRLPALETKQPRPGEPITLEFLKDGTPRYRAVVDVGTARQRKQQKRRFRTITEARAWLDEVRTDSRRGTYVAPSDRTFNDLADAYLRLADNRVRAVSVNGYTQSLQYAKDAFGTLPAVDQRSSDGADSEALGRHAVDQGQDVVAGDLLRCGRVSN